MTRKSREWSSKFAFLSTLSRFPFSFPLLLHPLSRSPLARVCPLADSYTSCPSPVVLALTRLPPVFPSAPTHISVHLFPSFPSRRHCHPAQHPREPSELSEPLWISPYATYWAQDVLRAVRERNLRAREMNPVKRPVAFINIAAGAFIVPMCWRASIYRVLDIPFNPSLGNNFCRNTRKFKKHWKDI